MITHSVHARVDDCATDAVAAPRSVSARGPTHSSNKWLALLGIGLLSLLAGCASLPPGSDFPKAASNALTHPEETRLGRQFEDAAREHGGNSAFRLLSVGVDGFLTRAQMINTAERTLDLEYYIFHQDETGQLLT